MKKLIVVVLLLTTPCWSQEIKPQEEKPQQTKKRRVADGKFWLAAATVIGATMLDVESTRRCMDRGGCREANFILGPNPSRQRMYSFKLPAAAFTIWGSWWWKRHDMRERERAESRGRINDVTLEPRYGWLLPVVVYSGITGGVGIRNLNFTPPKTMPGQTASSSQARP